MKPTEPKRNEIHIDDSGAHSNADPVDKSLDKSLLGTSRGEYEKVIYGRNRKSPPVNSALLCRRSFRSRSLASERHRVMMDIAIKARSTLIAEVHASHALFLHHCK